MDKFWKWMEDKDYGCAENIIYINDRCYTPTKQMIIGYMIEYLDTDDPIDDFYDELVNRIKED